MAKDYRLIIMLQATCLFVSCAQLGCQRRTTKTTAKPIAMLDEQQKGQYRKQLKRDPAKKFGPEFVRTTDLERALVDEYGFNAIRLIFEDRNSANYYQLGEFPTDCPWEDLNEKDIAAVIEILFEPISNKIPTLKETLKERCKYLYAEKSGESWTLHYFLDMSLFDGRRYYTIYSGGEANQNPAANANLAKYQWKVPPELRRLYAIHDGFGPILGSNEITVLAEMMDPICKGQNTYPEGYSFRDLLEFHPDGGGNAQCFHRKGERSTTVDWDHETREISPGQDFFGYLDERLSEIDEE